MLDDVLRRAAAAAEAGDFAEAKLCYIRSLELIPDHPKLINKFGETCIQIGHAHEAHAAFAKVLNMPRADVQD